MEKVMDPIPILGGLTGFVCSFVGVYYCRSRPRKFKAPDPIVVVHRGEDPGDPN